MLGDGSFHSISAGACKACRVQLDDLPCCRPSGCRHGIRLQRWLRASESQHGLLLKTAGTGYSTAEASKTTWTSAVQGACTTQPFIYTLALTPTLTLIACADPAKGRVLCCFNSVYSLIWMLVRDPRPGQLEVRRDA